MERNFRAPCGEIDIIASKGDTMAFVEVKLASEGSATMAWEKLDRAKRRRIAATAAAYLAARPFPGYCRFDVAVVRGSPGAFTVEYLEDAFRSDGGFTV